MSRRARRPPSDGSAASARAYRRAERAAIAVPPGWDPDSVVLAFRVPNELDGQRLDRFVQWRIPRLSRERAREIIEACACQADGTRRAPTDRVLRDETVLLIRERFVEPDAPREFGILHQDESMLIVDKPAGLPVHPSATYHRNTLTTLLRERFGTNPPHIAHRLDKETSGIVACATPGPLENAIKAQFVERTVHKEYLAIVRGRVQDDTLRIELPIRSASEGLHMLMETHPDGNEARTDLHVIERRGERTLVRLVPQTGRQHQLRVHLAAIGHPIVGDKLYGPEGSQLFEDLLEEGMSPQMAARLEHPRHALHAHALTLNHPKSGERMTFRSPLPADLVQLWAATSGALGEP